MDRRTMQMQTCSHQSFDGSSYYVDVDVDVDADLDVDVDVEV